MQENYDTSKESLLARYILDTNSTIRQTASQFNMSKSNVHNYVSRKLRNTNYPLYKRVQSLLVQHFEEKHIKGGEATRLKYKLEKERTR